MADIESIENYNVHFFTQTGEDRKELIELINNNYPGGVTKLNPRLLLAADDFKQELDQIDIILPVDWLNNYYQLDEDTEISGSTTYNSIIDRIIKNRFKSVDNKYLLKSQIINYYQLIIEYTQNI